VPNDVVSIPGAAECWRYEKHVILGLLSRPCVRSSKIRPKAAGHRGHDKRRPDRLRAAIAKDIESGEPSSARIADAMIQQIEN
jgi:hypothetical protein